MNFQEIKVREPRLRMYFNEKNSIIFKAGETIFSEGEPAETMFAVVEGRVAILKKSTFVEAVEKGGVFGELSLHPRNYDAVARTDCRLSVLDSKRFLYLVEETPFFALLVMQVMCERLNRMIERSVDRIHSGTRPARKQTGADHPFTGLKSVQYGI